MNEASPHIVNIGRMIEDMENKIRNEINEVYFCKTKDVVNSLRSAKVLLLDQNENEETTMKQELAKAISQRNVREEEDE